MRTRSTWAAWSMLAVCAVSVVAVCALSVVNGSLQQEPITDTVALLLAFAAFMVVGALIVAHRPGNAIGWIFSAIALLAITGALAQEYANAAFSAVPGTLPGAVVAAWYASWTWFPTLGLALVFTPLLFPSGRLVSRRWRPVAWLAGAVTAAIANPLGVSAIENPEQGPTGAVAFNLLGLLVVVAVVSMVVRFRRSRADERLQLKWFTFAAALLPLVILGDLLPDTASSLLLAAVIAFLPVAAGIAILRYRLYEIDRLINRTLVYGLLTVLLAGVYAGLVLVLGQLSGVADDPPSWVVAGATLAVAALFQPARRRIQAVVDRRFNRRRYDAARTVEAFSGRLRDQVDLDTLSAELLAAVDQTVQPTRASLWLRP
jgi:hypothetical protein